MVVVGTLHAPSIRSSHGTRVEAGGRRSLFYAAAASNHLFFSSGDLGGVSHFFTWVFFSGNRRKKCIVANLVVVAEVELSCVILPESNQNYIIMPVNVPDDLAFVKNGRLNVIAVRNGKSVEAVACDSTLFLGNALVVRTQSMDMVTFHPNVVFKVTLDFSETLQCAPNSFGRETSDWILLSCSGQNASYNANEERLTLLYCMACIESKVEAFLRPVNLVLKFDEDCWIVEKVYR